MYLGTQDVLMERTHHAIYQLVTGAAGGAREGAEMTLDEALQLLKEDKTDAPSTSDLGARRRLAL